VLEVFCARVAGYPEDFVMRFHIVYLTQYDSFMFLLTIQIHLMSGTIPERGCNEVENVGIG
jgi:hypothetical protein